MPVNISTLLFLTYQTSLALHPVSVDYEHRSIALLC